MEKDIIGKLSAKDHKYACALAEKLLLKAWIRMNGMDVFVILHRCLTIPIRL